MNMWMRACELTHLSHWKSLPHTISPDQSHSGAVLWSSAAVGRGKYILLSLNEGLDEGEWEKIGV